ncbi:metalloregulator ArsR/SmtB family transcription factor [Brevundimonas sp. 2R-24]|uniref:Metalloregulator ArsR/SmtB family transcription factor n=1 Tax=Peiella sedimenti TaxID=3061083 RepID=A0ABT8SNZ9_9CAUL|nr:metalloregulator ArsR/SmtB family transcription factor [Caulobacteraceae bacterium XZ-24]
MSPAIRQGALALLEAQASQAARLMGLFANRQRLVLLCRLSAGEARVNELAAFAGLSQSACSQHLARLRQEGVVKRRRQAQTAYYSLVDPTAARLVGALCDIFGGDAT